MRLEIAEKELVLHALLDAADGARDLARDEALAPPRALVVEEHAVADEETVCLAIVDREHVGGDLGHGVGAARTEGLASFCGPGVEPNISEDPAW